MDSLTLRNSPKTPNSEKFDAEILPSPYREGEVERSFRSEAFLWRADRGAPL